MDSWGIPMGSRTCHVFGADGWSLCRRHSPAPAMLRAEPREPICGACRKVAAVRAAVGDVMRVELRERDQAPAWTPPQGRPPPRKRRGRR